MDTKHRLDSPDNENLKTIEQVNDHSELGGLYPSAHLEWMNKDLLSREARAEKRDQEQQRISLTLREWFVLIGLLTPMPFVLGFILVSFAAVYLKIENLALFILPVVAVVLAWLYASYRSLKRVRAIFYEHSMKAFPFVVTLLGLLLISSQALYITLLGLYTDSLIVNAFTTGLLVLATSVAYSGILVFIWTAQNLSSGYKIGCLGIFAGIITLLTLVMSVY